MFEIATPTPATLTSVTPRTEKHGDEDVPAMSVGFRLTVPNTWLDALKPGMTELFYREANEAPPQAEIAEAKVVHLPKLRSDGLGVVELKNEYQGWTLKVECGIDDSSAITFGGCKVDKFRIAKLMEGGSVELALRVGSSDLDDHAAGQLWMLNGTERNITLIAPDRDAQPSGADGDAKSEEWPFPRQGTLDGEALPQSATTETTKGRRKGKTATAAFLEAHGEGA